MKKHITKLCGIILVCLLVAGALPFGVYAADYEITLNGSEECECEVSVTLPVVPPTADVVFAFDLTGSMGDILDAAKINALNIMQQLNELGSDMRFGVITYMDYTDYYSSYDYENQYGDVTSDYPYRMDCALTGAVDAVSSAVNSLELGYGEDGPESMTRMLYESYADETIGWRDGSRKILVHFGDSVPHDDDLNEGIGGDVYSTGGDPGRDAVMFTEDDLDLQTVLAGMAENNIQLLNCLSYGTENEFWDYWVYWAGLTGGECYEATGEKLPTQVIDAISLSLTAPTVSGLTLVPEEADFEPWIAGLSEPYSGPTGVDIPLTVTLKRPDGIPAGIYTFHMNAVDALGVEYGLYEFVITCNDIIEMYTIVFNAAGGTGGETIEVADGETPVPPAVEKEGFDFIGWEPAVVPAAADATYTAQWQETVPGVTWQITFDAAGGTGGKTIEVADGETPVPPPVMKEGFDFIGWEPLLVPATADATYTAQWKAVVPKTWQITFDAAGGTGGETIDVEDGAMPVPPPVMKEGYDFAGWQPSVVPATGDATYTAQWQETAPAVTWQITFDADGGTGGKTIDVEDGETPVPPTVEKEGFDFIGWEPLLVPATADATYTAQWQEAVPGVTWQITFDAAGGTGGETIEVADGAMPMPPPVMKEGYDFAGWEPSVVPATEDATYTAQWQETAPAVTWQITFDAAGGTGGETIDVEDGAMPVPPVVIKEGYVFTGWEPSVVPAAADATYTAQWEKTVPVVTWQITFDANGGTGGKTIEVAHGVMPAPPVVAKEGYVFAGWEPALSPATTNASYKAKWTAVPGETTTHRPEEPSTTKQPDVPSTGSAFNGAAVFTVLTLAAAAVYVTRKKKDLVK